jgi:hypothetical protein
VFIIGYVRPGYVGLNCFVRERTLETRNFTHQPYQNSTAADHRYTVQMKGAVKAIYSQKYRLLLNDEYDMMLSAVMIRRYMSKGKGPYK